MAGMRSRAMYGVNCRAVWWGCGERCGRRKWQGMLNARP